MRRKNILFITTNFPPNPSVGTRRVVKILKYANSPNLRFFILTLKEHYYNQELGRLMENQKKVPFSVKVYRTRKIDPTFLFTILKRSLIKLQNGKTKANKVKKSNVNFAISTNYKGVQSRIKKIKQNIFEIFEFPDKYIGWLPFAVVEGIRIIRREKIDIIFTTAPPHSVFLIALILKKLMRKKLVLDFRDPWAISRWDEGKGLRRWAEKIAEYFCINNADCMFFVTDKMRDEYMKIYSNIPKEKFKLFYNGFDPDDFKILRHDTKIKTKINQPFRFVHLGTLYKKRNPEMLLQALHNLIKKKFITINQVKFEFIGTVDRELQFIYEKIKELELENIVIFKPPISFKESIKTMFQADVLLLLQPDTDLQIPAKLFEYIYVGRPILAIAEENSATHQVLREGNFGIMAPSKNVEAIERAILTFLNGTYQFKPNQQYLNQFNYSEYIKEFMKVLNAI